MTQIPIKAISDREDFIIMYVNSGVNFKKQFHYFQIKNGMIKQLFRIGIVLDSGKVSENCRGRESNFKAFFNPDAVKEYNPIFFKPEAHEIPNIVAEVV